MRIAKVLLFVLALSPAVSTGVLVLMGKGGANPIDTITDATGIWTLRFVLATLAVTPIRRLTGWNPIVRVRRMLGLFAFFYGLLHFLTWLVLDQFFAWDFILADIAKRPYITVGFTGFVLMIPLAITSTAGWIRRLGGRWWNRLHRLVYATAVAGVEPRIMGISDDKGRLMVVITYNSDPGDAWEYEDAACYPEKYAGQSYRLGLNFIIYAMTH